MNARRLVPIALALCAGLAACGPSGQDPTDSEPQRSAAPTTIASPLPQRNADREADTSDAVLSAVRFVCSGQTLLDTPPAQIAEVIRGLWSASAGDAAVRDTVEQLVELRERLADGRGPTRYRQSVLATRVEQANEAEVSVSVWWVGVLSRDGAALPQAQWSTSLITLVAEDGAWKVASESSEPGPTPDHSSDAEPISNAELERRLHGFLDWEANR